MIKIFKIFFYIIFLICSSNITFANERFFNDGLKLFNAYLTTALKCVPPEDKPTSNELKACSKYLNNEIFLLKNINTILALGKIGFDSCIKFYKEKYLLKNKDFVFYHGCKYILPD